jgi:hypothetical protein
MQRGYVKLWRNIEDSGIMGNAELCRCFLHLLLKASVKRRTLPDGASCVELAPGQLIVGRKRLAADLATTERKVRTCLSALEKMGVIVQRPTSRHTVVSFTNWARYQGDHSAFAGRPPSGKWPDNGRTTATVQERRRKEEYGREPSFPPYAQSPRDAASPALRSAAAADPTLEASMLAAARVLARRETTQGAHDDSRHASI